MRGFFQIRLRTALLLLTACALPCVWLGANLRQWQAERRALAAIGPTAAERSDNPISIFC